MPQYLVPVFIAVAAENEEDARQKVLDNPGRRPGSSVFKGSREPEVGTAVPLPVEPVKLSEEAKAALKATLGE